MATSVSLRGAIALGVLAIMELVSAARADGDPTLRSDFESLRQRRIFFGHQSVGQNLVQGLQRLAAQSGISLQFPEDPTSLNISAGTFAHAHIAANGQPLLKLQSFERALTSGPPPTLDIALMKFCYVDIETNTDVGALFSKYQSTLANLRQRYPHTQFVHVTVPLNAIQSGLKARIKRLLGRTRYGLAENAKREEFNRLLRQAYLGREPIFDLAEVESTRPDGSRNTFDWNGQAVPALVSEYTEDGGHLNATGQLRTARQLVALLASLPLNRSVTSP